MMKMNTKKIASYLLEKRSIVILVILLLCACLFTTEFLKPSNLSNVLLQVATDGGGIDLSVGSQIALTSVIVVMMQPKFGTPLGVLTAVAAGLVIGLLNGLLITRVGISPFVTTLGMMTLIKGVALAISDSRSHSGIDPVFAHLADQRILGIPFAAIIFILFVLIGNWFLTRTTVGRRYYAVGGNPEAAWLAGLNTNALVLSVYVIGAFCTTNTNALVLSVYVIGAFCTTIAGILLTSRINTGSPIIAGDTGTTVISAILLGGTSMAGGIGTIYGTLVGTLILGILKNGMNLMGINGYFQTIILGTLLVISVLADRSHYDKKREG